MRSGDATVHAAESSPSPASSAAQPAGASADGATDPLSGLATRMALIACLDRLLAAPLPGRTPALILLDLDRFKTMNDRLGPLVCDRLLCRVAQRLNSVVPDAALIARVSGDGFAVLLHDGADAPSVSARLLDFLGRPYAVSGFAVTLGASVGVAVAGRNGDTPLALLHAADLAMHQAEQDGRNRICQFEPAMQITARLRQAMETDLRAAVAFQQVELRRALVSEQFEVHYQPQIAFAGRRLTGFEALVRWRHPVRGLVPPDCFIPLAEEIGLIELLGDWVLRTACRDAASWPSPGGAKLRIAVNISALQLRDGRALLGAIQRALAEAQLPASRLELELTESAVAQDPGATLRAIRALGADLALDDFGTGYSALSRLRCNPFTRIKIDRSFIADLAPDTADTPRSNAERHDAERMIRAIAALGAGLEMATVIEGIETAQQYDIARNAGCTEMQGYFVSRAVPSSAVPALIHTLVAQQHRSGAAVPHLVPA